MSEGGGGGGGRFRLNRHWLQAAPGTHLWAPEAKEIGCDLKITPVGEKGRTGGGRGGQATCKPSPLQIQPLSS